MISEASRFANIDPEQIEAVVNSGQLQIKIEEKFQRMFIAKFLGFQLHFDKDTITQEEFL